MRSEDVIIQEYERMKAEYNYHKEAMENVRNEPRYQFSEYYNHHKELMNIWQDKMYLMEWVLHDSD